MVPSELSTRACLFSNIDRHAAQLPVLLGSVLVRGEGLAG